MFVVAHWRCEVRILGIFLTHRPRTDGARTDGGAQPDDAIAR